MPIHLRHRLFRFLGTGGFDGLLIVFVNTVHETQGREEPDEVGSNAEVEVEVSIHGQRWKTAYFSNGDHSATTIQ